ncbi:diacylglycerol/lipid kinase family protein [Gordonia paraffinivorans]|uniref:Diacylglycerol kinase n=1 Tax=Gordonia paraffinivorans TaxID=175628 RepID=A0ABD7V467_9ACTN|nr:YegS/Rv2252/BmrU family lipid kinase [Gordonia paraffinivorans]MCD2145840.1 YegS/Rv2252/BmrU family lipid kinase [Gordonia paraffinivorans]VFA88985.1 Diacylglycerol kinase [Gordonia paraffinivorans]
MTIRHATIVASPYARHGTGLRLAHRAADLLRAHGVEVEVIVGEDIADAAERAGKAARGDTDVLVIAGGDGTVRLTVEAAYGSGKPLAVIPAGSGNDFARNLGIPLDVDSAVQVVLDGHREPVDLGRVTFANGRTALFSTVAATGFDAAVTARANEMRWPKGQARYTLAALLELIGLRPHHYQVRVDDTTIEDDLIFAAIGNTTSYGGGMRITPTATVSDGLLDITLARTPARIPRLTLARVFPKVFTGKHVDHTLVRTLRGAEIELYSDPPALVSVDGDLVGGLPAVLEAVPRAIEVFTPAR